MLDGLIRLALTYRPIVVALSAGLLAWGVATLPQVPLDVLPDITAPTVTVIVEAGGMAPTEIESQVTFPIESAVNGAPGVRRVRSISAVGFAVVYVEFEWGAEIFRARQTVAEKVALVSATLPPGVAPPVLAPISSVMGEILFISLESDRVSAVDLRTLADHVVRRRLLAVTGVSQVIVTGGGVKQYEVRLDPVRLAAHRLEFAQVEETLSRASLNSSPGVAVSGGTEYLIQGYGRATNVDAIAGIVLRAHDTQPLRVRDVGQVTIGEAFKRGDGAHNGRAAVLMGVMKQPGANTLDLTRRVEETLATVEQSLPAGVRVTRNIMRQADFIERSLENLRLALRDGAILVVIVVLVFLLNARAVFITLLALPMSMVAALMALHFTGQTLNSMSLGGLAIAIGELVDDAIIDVENVMRRLRENAQLPEADRLGVIEVVYRASREIRGSVVFATLIVGVVFVPLFALDSVEGRLLRPLAFSYLVALMASLAVALTLTPALCSVLLPRLKAIRLGHEPWLVTRLKLVYSPVLDWVLDRPRLVGLAALASVAAAGFGFTHMGREFLPEFNEGALTVSAVTLPGTSLAQSNELGSALERVMLSVNGVVSTGRRTGRAELDEHGQGVESAEIDVLLDLNRAPKDEILADLRESVQRLPGLNVTLGQPISHRIDHMLSGTRANVAVKIFGDDLATLRTLARRAESLMKEIPGVVDLAVEQQMDIPALRVRPDPERVARIGVPSGAVAARLESALRGRPVSRIYEGQVSFPLVVRDQPDPNLSDEQRVSRTMIDMPGGARVPLSALADIRRDLSPNFIDREDVQRKIVVSCNVAGRDLGGTVREIQEKLRGGMKLPESYRVEYGGQFESEQRASQRLGLMALGVVAAILLVLATAFRSYRDAGMIMLNLPLALVGGVIGVFALGGTLSLASIVGFITLLGIAARNGIMLVSHIRHVREEEGEVEVRAAVRRGAMERLSPILMTALAAGLALVPIALGAGKPGSELQAPMAAVILFGLASSTLLNMLVVPSLYLWLHRDVERA